MIDDIDDVEDDEFEDFGKSIDEDEYDDDEEIEKVNILPQELAEFNNEHG
ncbi:hypothetical protein QR98_0035120 [Sarcoptes scabiei]|uniref:Uncharacterized protein n=1 Tax=Sarcoptes scabiei TaxID=52283 RepID=A0A132A2A4_SARSC|nr:hypothetical protein QR98_0035120 [Sarcoptes scabiei]